MRNANTFWELGTRLRSLPVGNIRKQMVGDSEMPEDCRSSEKPLHSVKKFREGFLEEGIFELGRKVGVRTLKAVHVGQRGKGRVAEAGQAHHRWLACSAMHLGFVLEQYSQKSLICFHQVPQYQYPPQMPGFLGTPRPLHIGPHSWKDLKEEGLRRT